MWMWKIIDILEFHNFLPIKENEGLSRREESHLKTITIISQVSSYTFSMLIFWEYASIWIISKKYLF